MLRHLIVLDEEVEGVSLGEKGGPQLGIFHVPGNGADHELVGGAPPRIRHRTGRLEPVLPLPKLVGERHNGVVLDVVQAELGRHQAGGRLKAPRVVTARC